MNSTTRASLPLPVRLGVIGGLVLASLVPAGAAFADDPFPLPGLGDNPTVTPPDGFDPFYADPNPVDLPATIPIGGGSGGYPGSGGDYPDAGIPQDVQVGAVQEPVTGTADGTVAGAEHSADGQGHEVAAAQAPAPAGSGILSLLLGLGLGLAVLLLVATVSHMVLRGRHSAAALA